MDMNDILTRLQNGEDAQKIANEFADMLNGAIAQQKQAEADKVAAQVQKQDELQHVLDAALDWLDTYYPEFKTETAELNAADIIKALDESKNDIVELIEAIGELAAIMEKPVVKKSNVKVMSADDIITSFLKSNHLF